MPANWAERIDMKTGRPVKVAAHSPLERGKKVQAFPSAMGGKDQQPCSVDPANAAVFFCGTNNWHMELEPQERGNTMMGLPYVFANVMMKPNEPGALGIVKAFDVVEGKSKWEIKEKYPVWSGTLVTDGGLVFYGTLDGWFRAVDKDTGKKLWRPSCRPASSVTPSPTRPTAISTWRCSPVSAGGSACRSLQAWIRPIRMAHWVRRGWRSVRASTRSRSAAWSTASVSMAPARP